MDAAVVVIVLVLVFDAIALVLVALYFKRRSDRRSRRPE